ncbi:MAG: hypothetical protein GF364_10555 [Candidatus Lokiarchaeota archaeon]|nr:hypothetical protein [Candidatus Lokiarchaeota archaeon]
MQDKSKASQKKEMEKKQFISTRHRDAEPDLFDPSIPRLGRRESEPHSAEVSYLHDVLSNNFPEDRTMWDLHHYFKYHNIKIDIQFDISYFRNLQIPYTLSSYYAEKFNNTIPTMCTNILSKSTWRSDFAEKVEYVRLLQIPLYVVFPSYHVSIEIYKPPFLRVYELEDDGEYKIHDLRKITLDQDGNVNSEAIIDVSHIVPFRLGLKKRSKLHQDNNELFRLILLKPNTDEIFLTTSEKKDKKITEQERKITEQDKKISKQDEIIKKLRSENTELRKSQN